MEPPSRRVRLLRRFGPVSTLPYGAKPVADDGSRDPCHGGDVGAERLGVHIKCHCEEWHRDYSGDDPKERVAPHSGGAPGLGAYRAFGAGRVGSGKTLV